MELSTSNFGIEGTPFRSDPSLWRRDEGAFEGHRERERIAVAVEPPCLEGVTGTDFSIDMEKAGDLARREALLDRAMGPARKRKSSEKLRRGREPAEGLSFVARCPDGTLLGTVRLWHVTFGQSMASASEPPGRALLLGPLAVEPSRKGAGIGAALMRRAIEESRKRGYGAILLVGDAPYYSRFGFGAEKTSSLAMPGPYERERFLALELVPGSLNGAAGVLKGAGRKSRSCARALAAA